MRGFELHRDAIEVGCRFAERDARLEATVDAQVVRPVDGLVLAVEGNRRPAARLAEDRRQRRGRDADDGVRLPVQRDGAADRRRLAAEAAAPESFAQHDDRIGPGAIFFGADETSGDRRDAKERKQVGRHRVEADALGLAAARSPRRCRSRTRPAGQSWSCRDATPGNFPARRRTSGTAAASTRGCR